VQPHQIRRVSSPECMQPPVQCGTLRTYTRDERTASRSSLIIREAILTCDERLERWDSIPRSLNLNARPVVAESRELSLSLSPLRPLFHREYDTRRLFCKLPPRDVRRKCVNGRTFESTPVHRSFSGHTTYAVLYTSDVIISKSRNRKIFISLLLINYHRT